MKFLILSLSGLIFLFNYHLPGINTNSSPKNKFRPGLIKIDEVNKYDSFQLNYVSAGLGSNMGSMQPTFEVKGIKYIYTYEQNSFYGERSKEIDTLCTGNLRTTSIDSIIALVKNIKDSVIYNTNPGIMSGSIQYIHIKYENIQLEFRLHNASDPVAKQIITILNSNIPAGKKRLWLFRFPA